MSKATIVNRDIREAVYKQGLTLWRVAEQLGITDSTFSRWLRKELNQETKDKILIIIDQLKDEGRQATYSKQL